MFHQNFSSSFPSSSEQPNNLFSLTVSFENLQISKPLDHKRDEYLRSIRSLKRRERIHLKRMNAFSLRTLSDVLDSIEKEEGQSLQDYIDKCLRRAYSFDQWSEIIQALHSNDIFKEYFAVIGLRKLLSDDTNPPIQQILDAGVLPKLIEFLQRENEVKLQHEAAWVVLNLASGTTQQIQQILESGAIPVLIRLLESPSTEVQEQAIWALGNIAGDNFQYRDFVLQAGIVNPLIQIMNDAISREDRTLVKHGAWVLSNLCKGKPRPAFHAIKNAIPVLGRVIITQEDPDILTDATWTFSNISERIDYNEENVEIQRIIETRILPFLVKFLDHVLVSLVFPSIKTIGNLLTGNPEQTKIVLGVPGITEGIFRLLRHQKRPLRREAAWTISNIAAEGPEGVQHILTNACYLDQILELSLKETALEARTEAVWVLRNMIDMADQRQLEMLLERGILQHMSKILEEEGDFKNQEVAFRGIVNILNQANLPEGYSRDVCWSILKENKRAMEVIEQLKGSKDYEIAQLAHDFLDSENFE